MDDNKKLTEVINVIAEKEIYGKQFRVWNTPEEPLFLAKDVAEWLGYENKGNGAAKNMVRCIDDDEKVKCNVLIQYKDTYRKRAMWFLTEDGLYELTMLSTKPKAKQFKKEVKKMLKEIRLTGGYIPVATNMTDDEIMARAYEIAQRTLNMKVNQLN